MGHLRTNIVFGTVSIAALLLSVAVLFGYLSTAPSANTLRLGFFPNVTHAQALFGIATDIYRQSLRQTLGVDFALQPRAFNAGPTAIQALLANQVDLVFVGPSPTLSGLSAAGPDELRVIAGAASGGASFVIQPSISLATDADFAYRKFATPQRGNTQDIALKHYLLTRGHQTRDRGGDVDVINAPNADILTLFQLGQIDGAWVPEPWATRLIVEAGARLFLDERSLWPNGQFVTTHLVTTKRYLDAHQDILKTFLGAFVNVTLRLQQAIASDLITVNGQITNATGIHLSQDTVNRAFMNLNVTYDPVGSSLATYLAWAKDLGFIPHATDATSLYDLTLLNEILGGKGLPPVAGI